MNLSDIASILQVGFSGFAFLLAGMSYRLLHVEASREGSGRKTILASIHRYASYTLVVAIIALIGGLSEKGLAYYFDFQKLSMKQKEGAIAQGARACRGALDRLVNAEVNVNPDYSSLLVAIQQAASNCENTLEILEVEGE